MRWDYVISPAVIQFWDEKVRRPGPSARRSVAIGHSGCIGGARPPLAPPLAQAKAYGPIVSGALFGAGWWFWVDAVSCSGSDIPFPQVGGAGAAALQAAAQPRPRPSAAERGPPRQLGAADALARRRRARAAQYLPGIIATLALIMINCVRRWVRARSRLQYLPPPSLPPPPSAPRPKAASTAHQPSRAWRPPARRDDLQDYDPFDDGGFCRSRFWLFISYIVSFGAVAGAVWVLLQDYGELPRPALARAARWLRAAPAAAGQCRHGAASAAEPAPRLTSWPRRVRSARQGPAHHRRLARRGGLRHLLLGCWAVGRSCELALHCPAGRACCPVSCRLPPMPAAATAPPQAGLFQVACILGSGLLFFISRTPTEGGYDGYTGF
jgi:hypothetical protein